MNDIPKSIEAFLEKNGLTATLKAYQGESKRASNTHSKNAFASLTTIKNAKVPTEEHGQSLVR